MTNNFDIDYLLSVLALLEDEEKMKGTIRVREKCPTCKGPFEYVNKKLGYTCKSCKTIPTRFYIDIFYQGRRVRLFSDKSGQVLDSYARALGILSSINYEIKNHEFDPPNMSRPNFSSSGRPPYWTGSCPTSLGPSRLATRRTMKG